jgi:hypothetical protein
MSLEYLVMENYELPVHLQGQNGYIEVEGRKGLEPGRRYLLLTASREKPQIENLDIRQNHGMLVPDGTTAWWINVPLMPDRETWPDVLPPLAELPRPIKPIIKLESFVRVEPRSSMFLSGYPLKISSSQSNYEPFIKSQNGDRSIELEPIDGEWVLTTKCPSEVVVSLRCTSDMKEVEGSSKKVLFIDSETTKIEEVLPRLATAKYFEHTPQIPPYPSATVSLEGGIHMGMRDNKYPVYLVNDRPSVTIKSPLNSGVRLFIDGNERANGEKPWSTRGKHEAQARYKNGAVLDTVTFELLDAVDDNIISIEGLSDKKNSPTKFLQTYVIYIKASLPLPVQIYYQIKDKEYINTNNKIYEYLYNIINSICNIVEIINELISNAYYSTYLQYLKNNLVKQEIDNFFTKKFLFKNILPQTFNEYIIKYGNDIKKETPNDNDTIKNDIDTLINR